MKILALPLYPPTHASSYYRIYAYEPFLRSVGIECDIVPAVSEQQYQKSYLSPSRRGRWTYHAHECLSRFGAVLKAKRYDLIWLQKACSLIYWRWWPSTLTATLRPVVYDIDDAVFLQPPADAPGALKFLEDRQQIDRYFRLAEKTFCGNRLLCEYASGRGGQPVLLPTSIDTRRYNAAERNWKDKVTIGWIGSRATHRCLNSIGEIWKHLEKYSSRIEVLIVSDSTEGLNLDAFASIPVHHEQWSRKKEVELIQRMDIGLMPLEDSEFQKYKCGFKAIQYMACGIPVVCSPIGANRDIVADGESGLWASTAGEWTNALSKLVDSPDRRAELGQRGRVRAEQNFSLEVNSKILIETFEKVLEKA